MAGVSFLFLDRTQKTDFFVAPNDYKTPGIYTEDNNLRVKDQSEYTGFGPRLGIDARYDFGQGFGIVAGGSLAYFLGDLDTHEYRVYDFVDGEAHAMPDPGSEYDTDVRNNKSDHSVVNLRGNIGLDYVYFFDNENRSTIGIEVGYMADWYDDAVGEINMDYDSAPRYDTHSVTFSGPYAVIKGAF